MQKRKISTDNFFFTSLEFDFFRVQFKFAFRIRPLKTVHKRRPHKIVKNWLPSPLVCTGSTPPLSMRYCGHTIILKNPSFLDQKVRTSASEEPPCLQNVRTGQIPLPLSADVFYGQPISQILASARKVWIKNEII